MNQMIDLPKYEMLDSTVKTCNRHHTLNLAYIGIGVCIF